MKSSDEINDNKSIATNSTRKFNINSSKSSSLICIKNLKNKTKLSNIVIDDDVTLIRENVSDDNDSNNDSKNLHTQASKLNSENKKNIFKKDMTNIKRNVFIQEILKETKLKPSLSQTNILKNNSSNYLTEKSYLKQKSKYANIDTEENFNPSKSNKNIDNYITKSHENINDKSSLIESNNSINININKINFNKRLKQTSSNFPEYDNIDNTNKQSFMSNITAGRKKINNLYSKNNETPCFKNPSIIQN